MTKEIKAYRKYPHLTESDIIVLQDIDRRLKEAKEVIDFSRKKGIDQAKLKTKVINLTYKKRRLLYNEITVNVSGINKETWNDFGKKVGFNKRSGKVVNLIEEFLRQC